MAREENVLLKNASTNLQTYIRTSVESTVAIVVGVMRYFSKLISTLFLKFEVE